CISGEDTQERENWTARGLRDRLRIVVITEPWSRTLSPKVKVLFGYKDGHAKLVVVAPIGITVPVNLTSVEIEKIKRFFDLAYAWAAKSEDERKGGKGD